MLPSSLRLRLPLFRRRRSQVERRGGKRVVPARHTLGVIRQRGENRTRTASVQELSLKGIALLTDHEYPAGTVLPLLLINAAHTFSVEAELRVIRSFRVSAQQFFVAGSFGRALLHDELVPFIR